jgi:hypothetical protein
MFGMDLTEVFQILSSVLGIVGVSALLTTGIQIYETRQEIRHEYYRKLILTPDFLRFVGLLVQFPNALVYAGKEGDITKLTELTSALSQQRDVLSHSGIMFLLPGKLSMEINEMTSSMEESVRFLSNHQSDDVEDLEWTIGGTTMSLISLSMHLIELNRHLRKFIGIRD